MRFEMTGNGKLTRRTLLGGSAMAGAALGFAPRRSDAALDEFRPGEQLRAAVIGCGGIATHHARVNFAPRFKVFAVCDVDRQRAELYRNVAPDAKTICLDYRELLDRDDIDVVFVCTPDHWHTKITVDALRSGKDVYCEKPLTFSVDEGRLIQQVLDETMQILQVGTQQRSDPNFQTAVALAQSGRLGAVRRVTAAIGGGPVGGPFAAMDPPESLVGPGS